MAEGCFVRVGFEFFVGESSKAYDVGCLSLTKLWLSRTSFFCGLSVWIIDLARNE